MKKIIPVILCQLGILLLYTCPATAATRPRLTGIQFESPSGREDRIIFTLNGIIRPRIFEIKGKRPRVVIDLPDTGLARWLKNTTKTNGHFVRRIRLGMHKGKNPKTRVVLDLVPHQSTDFGQHFNRKDNILTISVYAAGGKPKATVATAKQPPAGIAPTGQEAAGPRQQVAGQQPKKTEAPIPAPALLPRQLLPKPAATTAAEQAVPESVSPAVPARPAEKIAGVSPPTAPVPVIQSITFDNRSSRGEMISFQLNGFYPPTVTGLEKNYPRVGCDFKNATVSESVKKLIACNGKYIKNIQVEPSHNPDKVKVVLNLVPGRKYDLQQIFFKKDNLFVIIVNTVNKKIILIGD